MGKALLGTHTTPHAVELLHEVRALRARVAELEQALTAAQLLAADAARERDEADDTITLDAPTGARA